MFPPPSSSREKGVLGGALFVPGHCYNDLPPIPNPLILLLLKKKRVLGGKLFVLWHCYNDPSELSEHDC